MESYILLLRQDNTSVPQLGPEEIQAIIAKYKGWGQRLSESGRLLGTNKLEGSGRVMRGKGADVRISDGPYTETKDVIGGYFVVTAASYGDAVNLCRDCPHLEFGGEIEIRRVEVVGGRSAKAITKAMVQLPFTCGEASTRNFDASACSASGAPVEHPSPRSTSPISAPSAISDLEVALHFPLPFSA